MKRLIPWIFSRLSIGLLVIVSVTALVEGCSYYLEARRTAKKMTREFTTKDDDYRKKMAIARFVNRSYYTRAEVDAVFQDRLISILKAACPYLLIATPGKENRPAFLEDLPKHADGRIDNLKLALDARRHGFDAVATGTVVDIAAYEEKRGLYWLRDTHYYVQVQVYVTVYDTETGAKLVDENLIQDVEVDETDYGLVRQRKQAPIAEITDTLVKIATLLGEKVCDALSDQRWKSYVVSREGQRVFIPCGRPAGLKKGMVLEAYNSTTVVKGIGEERFFLPGPKIGEIRITDVYPDNSEGVILNDSDIPVGSVVKIK